MITGHSIFKAAWRVLLPINPSKLCGNYYGRTGAASRTLASTAALCKTQMPPRPKVNEDDIEEKFLKGSGPGGQKINKTSSAVQLRHIPTGIVVKSQDTRSREQNRKIARQLLASKLEDIEKGDQSRNNVLKEVARKKKASKRKKTLRKYRKLEEAKLEATDQLTSGNDMEPNEAGELEAGEYSKALEAPGDSDAQEVDDAAAFSEPNLANQARAAKNN